MPCEFVAFRTEIAYSEGSASFDTIRTSYRVGDLSIESVQTRGVWICKVSVIDPSGLRKPIKLVGMFNVRPKSNVHLITLSPLIFRSTPPMLEGFFSRVIFQTRTVPMPCPRIPEKG
jgi:hypothetical protein